MLIKHLFLILFFFVACSSPSPEVQFRKARDKITHQVIKEFIQTMINKKLIPGGIGEGIDHSNGKQNFLSVVFCIDTLPDIDFARKMIVDAIQEFLNAINSTPDIQDYLAEYPFPIRFINVGIISQHEGTGLFSVSNFQNELNYYKLEQGLNGPSKEIHTELYEDAVRILAQQESK